ncbi:hypothetical protein PMAG_a4218 [Pseudoalteromonas mariniglutinosa NCIMB 1770]|nr:hypothetical protein [Pseudoalteromonas mariniglutinosa NCIMB 1770]
MDFICRIKLKTLILNSFYFYLFYNFLLKPFKSYIKNDKHSAVSEILYHAFH